MFFSKILPQNDSGIVKPKVHVFEAFNQSFFSILQSQPSARDPEKVELFND